MSSTSVQPEVGSRFLRGLTLSVGHVIVQKKSEHPTGSSLIQTTKSRPAKDFYCWSLDLEVQPPNSRFFFGEN